MLLLCCRQELFSVECQLLQNALEYQKYTTCIQEWQRKRASIDSIVKDSQELLPSASHDSHVTQQVLLPSMSHDSHVTQQESATVLSTNELRLPPVMPRPQQLITMATEDPHSISPDSGTDIGISGNHDNVVLEPEEVSTAREEVATLAAEKQRLEAQHRRFDRLLQETKAKMTETKEVSCVIPDRVFFLNIVEFSLLYYLQ